MTLTANDGAALVAELHELKQAFCDPDPVDVVAWQVRAYVTTSDPVARDRMLASFLNWSVTHPWAFDTLTALLKQTPPHDCSGLLAVFAHLVATGARTRPHSGPGHPPGDFNANLKIGVTVRVLMTRGYSKNAACQTVADWMNEAPWSVKVSAKAVWQRVRNLETARPFPS